MTYKEETLIANILQGACDYSHNTSPPLYLGTAYKRDQHYNKTDDRAYIRGDNKSLETVTAMLVALEHGHDGLIYSSGASAMSAPFFALKQGDNVVIQQNLYFGLPKFLHDYIANYGINIYWVTSDDTSLIQHKIAHIKPALVWLETPSNPHIDVLDIQAIAASCKECKAYLAVDSTVASPIIQKPLTLGADFVVHSATKILNGHNDLLAGVIICSNDSPLWQRIKQLWFLAGWQLSSLDSYLLARGMKTLALRVERQSQNALAIAQFLAQHKAVSSVRYPGLSSHPHYAIAVKQMRHGCYGPLLNFQLQDGADACLAMLKKLNLVTCATSFGGVSSFAEHRATVEGAQSISPSDLIRFSAGIEHIDDLLYDIDQALHHIS